ncbi:(-)-germacrene D synthase [Linum grandiflorum]
MAAAATVGVPQRRTAEFHPSPWGDFFLTHVLESDQTVNSWNEEIEALKCDVRRTLLTCPKTSTEPVLEMLSRVDAIERLGIHYHFEAEIQQVIHQLYQIFGSEHFANNHVDDLSTVALAFRLLRQHNYNARADVFKKYKTEEGDFKDEIAKDIEGMLSLYEAGYLRTTQGDDSILDEAIAFATAQLRAKVDQLESPNLVERVNHSLERPLRKGVERTEHLFFISIYGGIQGHDPILLRLAKLSFNVVQNMYQKELRVLTKWWIELGLPKKLTHARDKLVEVYFWGLGAVWEPKFALARYIFTKVITVGSMFDDTYDAYGTIEELELFTAAVENWETSMEGMEERMRILFQAIIDVYDEIDSITSKEGRPYCLPYGKLALKNVVQFYMQEARWFGMNYVPSVEEYRHNSSLSTLYQWAGYTVLCGLGDAAPEETFDWLFSTSKLLVASSDHCRLIDDIFSHEFEQKRGHVASSVDCYMKQHGAAREDAIVALKSMAEEDWKIMNEEFLTMLNPPTTSCTKGFLQTFTGLAQVMEVLYKYFDGYTNSDTTTKDLLTALLVDPFLNI